MAVKKKGKETFELKLNDKNEHVAEAQKMLAKVGSKIQISGEYTIGTRSAVCAFQKKNKLTVTGIIDKKTWDALAAKTRVVKRTAPSKKTATTKKGAGKK